jgi:hypothetical protein
LDSQYRIERLASECGVGGPDLAVHPYHQPIGGVLLRGHDQPAASRTQRFGPQRALVVLLLTGLVQTIAEPVRQFVAPAFWWKMFMIICVLALTVCFARAVRRNAEKWDTPARSASAKSFALISLGLWIAIIFCGRFIGYTWELYL